MNKNKNKPKVGFLIDLNISSVDFIVFVYPKKVWKYSQCLQFQAFLELCAIMNCFRETQLTPQES